MMADAATLPTPTVVTLLCDIRAPSTASTRAPAKGIAGTSQSNSSILNPSSC